MDFEIFPQLMIIVSVAGILVIISKNFSKIKLLEQEEIFLQDVEEQEEREKFFYLYQRAIRRFVNREKYQQKVTEFWLWLEKALRKVRIASLKIDSKIVSLLQNLRQKNIEKVDKIKENQLEEKEISSEDNFDGSISDIRTEKKPETIKGEDGTVENLDSEEVIEIKIHEGADEEASENNNASGDEVEAETDKNYEIEVIEKGFVAIEKDETEKKDELEQDSSEEIDNDNNEESKELLGGDKNISSDDKDKNIEHSNIEQDEREQSDEKENLESDDEVEIKKVYTKKEQEYIDTLIKDPRDVKSYWGLGILYSRRKNYEDALACFRQIVKIDPTYTKAKQKAIELMEKMRNRRGRDS